MPRLRSAAVRLAIGFVVCAGAARAEINPANFDPSVRPQDDMYRYANGGWLKRNPVPAQYSSWGAFDQIQAHNEAALHRILQQAALGLDEAQDKTGPLAPIEARVGAFYASGMNVAAVDAAGVTPLEPELKRIAALRSTKDVQAEIARLHRIDVDCAFAFGSEQDPRNSVMMIGGMTQGGLGLPDRDYYTRTDEKSVTLRRQYVDHVAKLLALAGITPDEARAQAGAVMELETALAQSSKNNVDLRDPVANYHKTTMADLARLAPDFDWRAYFVGIGLQPPDFIDVGQPDFVRAFDRLIGSEPIATWRAYLRWHLLHWYAPYLSSSFVNENFAFFDRTLTGTPRIKDRWKRVMATVDASIGDDLARLFVAECFPPQAKERARALVATIRAALRDRLKNLTWMDEPTRQRALAKLEALGVKIGYPDKWIDYSSIGIDRNSYAGNVLRANAFGVARDLRKIGKPVDRAEWDITAPTVNAYYSPNMNEIVFPAGILQPPFFDPSADDAEIYGGIGAIIGHEMTHGFDDEGRQYDPHGNLVDWWTPESARRFEERAKAIVKQFSAYVVLDGLHVNGELTQGENIADLGGVKLAYHAYQRALAARGPAAARSIGGFTPDQRFFLSFATIWRENDRPDYLRMLVNTDPHSPPQDRANGPLSNLPEFFKAFHVPPGAPLRRPEAERVEIW